MQEDPLSTSLSTIFSLPSFFPAQLLEVCPRKQSGTCATTAADPTIPIGWWKKIGKEEEGKRDVSQKRKKYRGQIFFDRKVTTDQNES